MGGKRGGRGERGGEKGQKFEVKQKKEFDKGSNIRLYGYSLNVN